MKPFSLILTLLLTTTFGYSQSKYAKKFAYINPAGKIVFYAPYKYVQSFSNGRAEITMVAKTNGKAYFNKGFIDTTGKIVIEALYDKVYKFKESVTWVRKRGESKFILIDQFGKRVGNEAFDKVSFWFDGLCKVTENGKIGFINTKGELVVDPKEGYIDASAYTEGLACVAKNDGGYGFIDKEGNVVIPLKYKQGGTSSFKNGLTRVKINGKTGLINREGEIVVQPKYGTVSGFGDSLLVVAFGSSFDNFGYVNFKNEVVIKGQFYRAEPFSMGYAAVSKDGKEGIIDKSGNYLIPLAYETIYNSLEKKGYFMGVNDRVWTYFDKTGKEITEIEAKSLTPKPVDIFPIRHERKSFYYYNNSSQKAYPIKYCRAEPFTKEGLALVLLCD